MFGLIKYREKKTYYLSKCVVVVGRRHQFLGMRWFLYLLLRFIYDKEQYKWLFVSAEESLNLHTRTLQMKMVIAICYK